MLLASLLLTLLSPADEIPESSCITTADGNNPIWLCNCFHAAVFFIFHPASVVVTSLVYHYCMHTYFNKPPSLVDN